MKKESSKIAKRSVIFIIVIFVFISCKSFQIGEYKNNKSYDEIIFKNDSTYIYNKYNLNFEYSSGIWKGRGNKILLNSHVRNKTVPVEISQYENTTSKDKISIRINIITSKKNDDDYYCEAFTNNQMLLFDPLDSLKPLLNKKSSIDILQLSKSISKKNGSYCFSVNHSIDSLYFKLWKFPQSFIGKLTNDSLMTEGRRIMVNLGDSIDVNILLNDSLFGYKIFNNKEIKYRNNCLIFENRKLKISRNK